MDHAGTVGAGVGCGFPFAASAPGLTTKLVPGAEPGFVPRDVKTSDKLSATPDAHWAALRQCPVIVRVTVTRAVPGGTSPICC